MKRGYAPRNVFRIDDLAVLCWCEERIVHVPASVIRSGQTASCGARQCHGPEAA